MKINNPKKRHKKEVKNAKKVEINSFQAQHSTGCSALRFPIALGIQACTLMKNGIELLILTFKDKNIYCPVYMYYLSNFDPLCIVALFFRPKNFYHDAIMLCSNSLSMDSNSIINALM